MQSFKNNGGKDIVLGICEAIKQNKDYLSDIDGAIGDGDHGMNMNKGFSISAERISGVNIPFSQALYDLGDVLISEIGRSMGPIYGPLFMEMGDTADGTDDVTAEVFAQMMNNALDGLYDIVDARVGDKTLMDVMIPAAETFDEAEAAGKPFSEALNEMKTAAEKGRDSTKDLVAKFGRRDELCDHTFGDGGRDREEVGLIMDYRQNFTDAINHKSTRLTPWVFEPTKQFAQMFTQETGEADFEAALDSHVIMDRYKKVTWLNDKLYEDAFGTQWQLGRDGGDIGIHINKVINEENIESYVFPEIDEDVLAPTLKTVREDTNHFRVFRLSYAEYERAWSLMDMEDILLNMAMDEQLTARLFERITEYHLKLLVLLTGL